MIRVRTKTLLRDAGRLMTLLALFCMVAASAEAQTDFEVPCYTVDGGGSSFCTGDEFELSGTIGQPDANVTVMAGGGFELAGGFWAGAAEDEFCFGDLDDDGAVGLSDLAQLLSNYGETSGATYEDGDLDDDGDVDLADLAALLAVYGTSC